MLNTTLIDHEAGKDPILDQPTDTVDQIDKRYKSLWNDTMLPSDERLASFIDQQVKSWKDLLGHNETDRIFIMKMVDKMYTGCEDAIDAMVDKGKDLKKQITKFNDRENSGSCIDRNHLDDMQEQHQKLQHQFIFGRYVMENTMPVIRDKMLVETNLTTSCPPSINRRHTKKSRQSIKTYSPESTVGKEILKNMHYNKTNNKAYISRTKGIDDPSSSNNYDIPADYEIDNTSKIDNITIEDKR